MFVLCFWAVAACTWLSFIIFSSLYLFTPIAVFAQETAVLDVATAWAQGFSIYTKVDEFYRYSTLYGPLTYLFPGIFIKWFNSPLIFSKLPSIICFWSALYFFYLAIKNLAERLKERLIWITLLLAQLGFFYNNAYSVRPDVYLFFSSCLALFVSENSNLKQGHKLIFLCLLMAFSSHIKIHGFLYILPALVPILMSKQIRKSHYFIGIFIALIAFGIPFAVSGIDFMNYFEWLHQSVRHGVGAKSIWSNLSFILPFAILLSLFSLQNKKSKLEVLVVWVCILFVTLFASKKGSGPSHYIPFLPVFIYLWLRNYRHLEFRPFIASRFNPKVILFTFYASWIALGLYGQFSLARFYFNTPKHWNEFDEISSICKNFCSENVVFLVNSDFNHFRSHYSYSPYIVQQSHRLWLNPVAMMDMQIAGLSFPESTYQLFNSCTIKYAILPTKGRLIDFQNPYTNTRLYPDRLRDLVQRRFHVVDTRKHFQVLACKVEDDT